MKLLQKSNFIYELNQKIKKTIYKYIVNHSQKIPDSPEYQLFSKELKKGQIDQELMQFTKQNKIKVNDYEEDAPVKIFQRTDNFHLKQEDYFNFMKQDPKGKINIFNYKNTHFTLVSSQYEFLPAKNIYKILSYSKPDAILIQMRPDQILSNFKLEILNPQTQKFSNRLYFNQLVRKGYEIMPSQKNRLELENELQQNNILVQDVSQKNQEFYIEYQKNIAKKFKQYNHRERLSEQTITAASFYAERSDLPMILGDVPEIVFRQNIANKFTLLQLQNIFTKCCRELQTYPDIQPQTPLNMAFYLYPEVFLEFSDKYMSTLLEYMTGKYKRIICLTGYAQSQSISQYLEYRKISSLQEELKLVPLDYADNILAQVTSEELIEKHAILDVMFHGHQILKNLPDLEFKSSFKIISKYSDPNFVDSNRQSKMTLLHYRFLQKYADQLQINMNEGQQKLQRDFIKKVTH